MGAVSKSPVSLVSCLVSSVEEKENLDHIPGSRPGNFHTFHIPPLACEVLQQCPSLSSSRLPLPPPPPHLEGMAELHRRGCRAASHTLELAGGQCMCRLKSRVLELAASPLRQADPAIRFRGPDISSHVRKDDYSGITRRVLLYSALLCWHSLFAIIRRFDTRPALSDM
jgi:hypothetical protein